MRDALGAVQSVFVLGGGSEIALTTVRRMISDGHTTRVVLGVREPGDLAETAEELRTLGATAVDVKAMKVEQAKAIYRAKYWAAQRCDDLPAGVDNAVFDYGVNSGIGRSGKVLRRVLGLRDNDWRTSDEVLAAFCQHDPQQVVVAICEERLRFLRSLKTWSVFGQGWAARVAEVKAFSLQLAAGAPSPRRSMTPAISTHCRPTVRCTKSTRLRAPASPLVVAVSAKRCRESFPKKSQAWPSSTAGSSSRTP